MPTRSISWSMLRPERSMDAIGSFLSADSARSQLAQPRWLRVREVEARDRCRYGAGSELMLHCQRTIIASDRATSDHRRMWTRTYHRDSRRRAKTSSALRISKGNANSMLIAGPLRCCQTVSGPSHVSGRSQESAVDRPGTCAPSRYACEVASLAGTKGRSALFHSGRSPRMSMISPGSRRRR